ncbi:hypothetical protein JOC77_003409 [Peribacillus deserti]|uniref:Spore coat protein n=1 Tax=Peribacillus deserti TaxID=673318 RepID=A0ABS2QLB3_9BACI|nr:hypothetical protein [Peribacillus deserti]MBM7693965.1 hypothetical protein [Peribacillus deserti]
MASNKGKHDRISDFMFGTKNHRQHSNSDEHDKLAELMSKIDLDQLLNQVDSIMTVYDQFKPAIKQLSPIMDIILKRKK